MINELRKVIEDIRTGKNIESYVLSVVAIIIAGLDVFGVTSQSVINAAVLGTLAVLVYGRVLDRRRIESQVRGIREFHSDRSTVPSLHSTLSAAQHELLLIGVSLSSIVHTQQGLLKRLAQRGCKIKIAVWKPPSGDPDRVLLFHELEEILDVPDLERNLPGNLERFKHFYSSLDPSARQNIEIRGYSALPTLSILFIDQDHSQGFVHVEPLIYRSAPEELPSFRLGMHDSPKLFQTLKRKYTQLWDNSEPLFQ